MKMVIWRWFDLYQSEQIHYQRTFDCPGTEGVGNRGPQTPACQEPRICACVLTAILTLTCWACAFVSIVSISTSIAGGQSLFKF